MFEPLRITDWLDSVWDRCVSLAPRLISVAETRLLARKFVGCNLVLDLAGPIDDILHQRNTPLAPAVTAADVHRALAGQGPSPANGLAPWPGDEGTVSEKIGPPAENG